MTACRQVCCTAQFWIMIVIALQSTGGMATVGRLMQCMMSVSDQSLADTRTGYKQLPLCWLLAVFRVSRMCRI